MKDSLQEFVDDALEGVTLYTLPTRERLNIYASRTGNIRLRQVDAECNAQIVEFHVQDYKIIRTALKVAYHDALNIMDDIRSGEFEAEFKRTQFIEKLVLRHEKKLAEATAEARPAQYLEKLVLRHEKELAKVKARLNT